MTITCFGCRVISVSVCNFCFNKFWQRRSRSQNGFLLFLQTAKYKTKIIKCLGFSHIEVFYQNCNFGSSWWIYFDVWPIGYIHQNLWMTIHPFLRSRPDKTTGNSVESSLASASAATQIPYLARSTLRSVHLVPACIGGSLANLLGQTCASLNQWT